MIVQCSECQVFYDDTFRWTICPHETFAANDGKNNFAHHPQSYRDQNPPPHQWEPDFSEGEPAVDSKVCGLCGKEHK